MRTHAALLCSSLLFASSAAAQVEGPPGAVRCTAAGSLVDNVKGDWVLHETSPVAPLFVDPILGAYVVAVNQPASRLSIVYDPTGVIVGEVQMGPGLVSIAQRPGTGELWAVDAVTNAVSVVDPIALFVRATIPVPGEPAGIAFLPDGSRAYVACRAGNCVAVIDCAARALVKSIALEQAATPHTIAYLDGAIWVAPLHSGNDTTGMTTVATSEPFAVQRVVKLDGANGNHLPDRDLFRIVPNANAALDDIDRSWFAHGVGTTLFAMAARPGTHELWIANTEAQNGELRGEKAFAGGRVVENRVTVVDVSTHTVHAPIDLDALAPGAVRCAQPAAIAFSADGSKAYVAGYGSDVVAILDVTGPGTASWSGHAALQGRTPPRADDTDPTPLGGRFGPRGLWPSADGKTLFVYGKADDSYARIDLSASPPSASAPISLGFDPTSDAIKRGRSHAIANLSEDGTAGCAACHIDGDHDRVVWDLGKFLDDASTPPDELTHEKDAKGPMATQTLRGLVETGPFHWRGEQRSLDAFNPAFVDLLKRDRELSPEEFQDLRAYVFSLVHPANSREAADREPTGDALAGRGLFLNRVVTVANQTCALCHAMPHGTNAGVMHTGLGPPAPSAKVAPLRGVFDKLAETFEVFPAPLVPGTGLDRPGFRTVLGNGLIHTGAIASLQDFTREGRFINMDDTERDQLATFLAHFDTALAPATAFQRTIDDQYTSGAYDPAAKLALFDAAFEFARARADAGDCDLVAHATSEGPDGTFTNHACWDPTRGVFQLDRETAIADVDTAREFVKQEGTTVTLIGVALGSGWRAIDLDHDGLLDGDELDLGTDPETVDSDGDGAIDGHEHAHGSDPADATSTPHDGEAPAIVQDVRIVWQNLHNLKLEFATSEPCRAWIEYQGVRLPTATTSPRFSDSYDVNHSIYATEIPSSPIGVPVGVPTGVVIHIEDRGGNSIDKPFDPTLQPTFLGVRVLDITMPASGLASGQVDVWLGTTQSTPIADDAYLVEAFAYFEERTTHALTTPIDPITAVAGAGMGVAHFSVPQPPSANHELHFGVRDVRQNPTGPSIAGVAYIEGEDARNFKTFCP